MHQIYLYTSHSLLWTESHCSDILKHKTSKGRARSCSSWWAWAEVANHYQLGINYTAHSVLHFQEGHSAKVGEQNASLFHQCNSLWCIGVLTFLAHASNTIWRGRTIYQNVRLEIRSKIQYEWLLLALNNELTISSSCHSSLLLSKSTETNLWLCSVYVIWIPQH